jgi:hypothetical protein
MTKTETAAKARLARHNNHICVCVCVYVCEYHWSGGMDRHIFPHTLFMAPMDMCCGGGCASC